MHHHPQQYTFFTQNSQKFKPNEQALNYLTALEFTKQSLNLIIHPKKTEQNKASHSNRQTNQTNHTAQRQKNNNRRQMEKPNLQQSFTPKI
jgi:virulence-associated protein VagC